MDPQRGHEIGAVHGNRVHAQVEDRRDFLVGIPLGDQLQNLFLARREAFVIRIGLPDPFLTAHTTNSVVRWIPSADMRLARCTETVFTLKLRIAAISLSVN